MVTDWFNKNLGTPYETSPIPYLYHPYVGHDNNRDMYMFTQKESQHTAQLLWHDWFPVGVARRAPDGQQRRAHLRDAGDRSDQPERASADLPLERHPRPVAGGGARSGRQGRHHLQLHLHQLLGRARWRGAAGGTTRSACSPKSRARASRRRSISSAPCPDVRRRPPARDGGGRGEHALRRRRRCRRRPTSTRAPSIRARGWAAAGRSRDIVDYELIATMALLETAADRRETILRQIYEVNRADDRGGQEGRPVGDPRPGRAPARRARSRRTWSRSCRWAASRSTAPTRRSRRTAERTRAGTFVDPDDAGVRALREGHAREADLSGSAPLARRRRPSRPTTSPPGRSACCSASTRVFVKTRAAGGEDDAASTALPKIAGERHRQRRRASRSTTTAPTRAIAINRLLKDGARVGFDAPSHVAVDGVARATDGSGRARASGSTVDGRGRDADRAPTTSRRAPFHAPRVGDVPAVDRRQHGRRLDALGARAVRVQPDVDPQRRHPRRQAAPEVRRDHPRRPERRARSSTASTRRQIRPEYRGGIGDAGSTA